MIKMGSWRKLPFLLTFHILIDVKICPYVT
jgi:hypothetical protein